MKENTQTTLGPGPQDTAQIEQKDEELQGRGWGESKEKQKGAIGLSDAFKQIYLTLQQQYLDGHRTTVTLINRNNDFTKKV